MYGAETSIPKKANVGQLVPPDGDDGCDGMVPLAACFQATDVELVETLKPRSLKSFLYSQLINLEYKKQRHSYYLALIFDFMISRQTSGQKMHKH